MNSLKIAALLAAGLNVEVLSTEEARKRWPSPEPRTIEPPPRYRDIKIACSYDDNVIARTPKAPDPERLSAAEAKRLRKAAKFKRENST